MKIKEVRDLSDAELGSKERELRDELFQLNLQKITGRLEKPHRIRDVRRTVAKLQTVANERRKKQSTAATK